MSPAGKAVSAYAWHFVPAVALVGLVCELFYVKTGFGKYVSLAWGFLIALDIILKPLENHLRTWTNPPSLALLPIIPLYLLSLAAGIATVTEPAIGVHEAHSMAIIVGFGGALFMVPGLHLLAHRRDVTSILLTDVASVLISYPHFTESHENHHREVGTPKDNATARVGESFYKYFERSFFGGLAKAATPSFLSLTSPVYALESMRLPIKLLLVPVAYGFIAFIGGSPAVIFLALTSIIAIVVIELTNFVQHYGLISNDRENAMHPRAWDSPSLVSNVLLLGLPSHDAHHREPSELDGHEQLKGERRFLPTSILLMYALPLFPPVWQYVMDPRVAEVMKSGNYQDDNSTVTL
ncbi:MAG: fatty acid desaturase [Gammaproteobacteria bacterium]